MGLKFFINKNVLIPRQETEILVEAIIKLVAINYSTPTILEIGTGSGNIAISLAKYIPTAKIVATDISEKALKIARRNAKLNNVFERISFLHSDLFPQLNTFCSSKIRAKISLTGFDIIVSNPPYIRSSDIEKLQNEVKCEPRIALNGGGDGLNFYRRIIPESRKFLNNNGLLVFEIGNHHSEKVKKLLKKYGLKNIKIINDYQQQERVIYGIGI